MGLFSTTKNLKEGLGELEYFTKQIINKSNALKDEEKKAEPNQEKIAELKQKISVLKKNIIQSLKKI